MEIFAKAKTVRLRSHHDKYLVAEDDEEGVIQDRSGATRAARWEVELVEAGNTAAKEGAHPAVRLKSCYGRYLSASNAPFLLGMTGRKVLQAGGRLDSSMEWEPLREGVQVKLRTRYGHFLRANGGLPPWRNSVTHDVPHRTATKDWVLWDVDVVEVRVPSRTVSLQASDVDVLPSSPASSYASAADSSPREASTPRGRSKQLEPTTPSYRGSTDSPRNHGRTIHYVVATSDDGDVVADEPASVIEFGGSGVDELTARLRDETGQEHIVVCTRSPLNGKLFPLRLRLPPANSSVSVVVVPSASKLAKSFPQPPPSPDTP